MKPESYYRDLLARQVGGRTEVRLPFGRADVMTNTMVWEVEPARRYPEGVRQALQYGVQTGLPAALAAYGPANLVTKVFSHLAKLPAPGVELWWFDAGRFVQIQDCEHADSFAPDGHLKGDVFREAVRDLALNKNFAHSKTLQLALLELLGYDTEVALDLLHVTDAANRSRTRTKKRQALAPRKQHFRRKVAAETSSGLIQDDVLAAAVRAANLPKKLRTDRP